MLPGLQPDSMGKSGQRLAIESHVRPTLIVVPASGFDNHFRFFQCFKPVQVQALIPKRSIEAFDMAGIGWFSRPAEIHSCLVMVSP